jgi:hypothetical protein
MSTARTRGTALAAALALMAGFGVTACEEEGPAEEAGEAVDESAEDVGEALEDTGDKVEDTMN